VWGPKDIFFLINIDKKQQTYTTCRSDPAIYTSLPTRDPVSIRLNKICNLKTALWLLKALLQISATTTFSVYRILRISKWKCNCLETMTQPNIYVLEGGDSNQASIIGQKLFLKSVINSSIKLNFNQSANVNLKPRKRCVF
jgi:hypothetical protein